jgi:hypothetical protein
MLAISADQYAGFDRRFTQNQFPDGREAKEARGCLTGYPPTLIQEW